MHIIIVVIGITLSLILMYLMILGGHGLWKIRSRVFAVCDNSTYYYRGNWFGDKVHVWEKNGDYKTTFLGGSGSTRTVVNRAERESFDRFEGCELAPEVKLVW